MEYYNRYDKNVLEPFALKTTGLSFNKKYLDYYHPCDTDNYDYISPDGSSALKITSVIPKNAIEAYKYEKAYIKGKNNLKKDRIKDSYFNINGELVSNRGGSIKEIKLNLKKAIDEKAEKTKRRLTEVPLSVDLCICVMDGGLLDLYSFSLAFDDLSKYPFDNIFFFTSLHFISYNKTNGFVQHTRIICKN